MQARIGRFHNIYGPFGTWKGGREKAPAAFCRKVSPPPPPSPLCSAAAWFVWPHTSLSVRSAQGITATSEFEMWGNGKQTRSFCYIDDAVEGIIRLMVSDYKKPLNIGSDEQVRPPFPEPDHPPGPFPEPLVAASHRPRHAALGTCSFGFG